MKTKKNSKKFNLFRGLKPGRVILVALLVCIRLVMFNHGKAAESNPNQYITVTVYPGDTIWSLAAKNNPDNIDIRKLVYNIREENNLKSANIYPGQQLNIPID